MLLKPFEICPIPVVVPRPSRQEQLVNYATRSRVTWTLNLLRQEPVKSVPRLTACQSNAVCRDEQHCGIRAQVAPDNQSGALSGAMVDRTDDIHQQSEFTTIAPTCEHTNHSCEWFCSRIVDCDLPPELLGVRCPLFRRFGRFQPFKKRPSFRSEEFIKLNAILRLGEIALRAIHEQVDASRALPMAQSKGLDAITDPRKEGVSIIDRNQVPVSMCDQFGRTVVRLSACCPEQGVASGWAAQDCPA